MYLLTKENEQEQLERETYFTELIRSGFAKDDILRYRNFFEGTIFPKLRYKSSEVDLEKSLRGLLTATILRAGIDGYRIAAKVMGTGVCSIPYDWFSYLYLSILRKCVDMAENKFLRTNIKLSENQLLVRIIYRGNNLPKLEYPFYAKIKTNYIYIIARFNYVPVTCGKTKPAADYLLDRLSPVNLLFC